MDKEQQKLAEEILFSEKKHPSFVKILFSGQLDAKPIYPYPLVSNEEKQKTEKFLIELKEKLDKELDPVWIDRHAEIPESVIKTLGEIGLLGITIPKEFGGLGMSQYAYCRAIEEISSRCGATALFVNAHQSIGLKALLLYGTEEQKKKWLIPLAKGEKLAAFSLTEPNAGSDASAVETRAVFDKDKNVYRINGKKQWTTNGSIASVLTVMAKTAIVTPKGVEEKITAFLVTPDMPGFIVTAKALDKVGMRGSKTANLEFKDMEVPASHILGPLGGGLKVCLSVLDYGRTTFGATCLGAAKFLLEKAVKHSRNRKQFNRPLSSLGLVKEKIAKMSALVYAMDATTYMTASFVDEEIEDFMLEAAILKVFTSDSLWQILYDTMQIYGGRSFFTDAPFERMMRDARLNMIGEGSNEVMRVFIGVVGLRDLAVELKDTLDKIQDPFNHLGDIKNFSKSFLKRFSTPELKLHSKELAEESYELGKAVRRFGFSILKLLGKYREQIVEQQMPLNRLATVAISLYTTSCVLSKIDTDMQNKASKETDFFSAKLYCKMTFDEIKQNLDTLLDNYDEEIEKLSDKVTGVT